MTQSSPTRSRDFRGALRLGLGLLLLLGGFAYTARTLLDYFEVAEIALPNLVGMNQEMAVAQLNELGIEALTFTQNDPLTPVNSVTTQSPRPGTLVREGRRVSLGINETSTTVAAPALLGRQQNEAEAILNEAGLGLGDVAYSFNTAAAGTVLGQSPQPSTPLEPGAEVALTVSRGPDIALVRVPDVRGLNIEVAKNQLRAQGFTTIDTTATTVSFEKPQTVTDQTPLGGQAAPLSTRVLLHYSLSTTAVTPVPDLTGMSLGRAQLLLRATGLSLGGVSYVDDPAQGGGVLSYEPADYTLSNVPVSLTLNTRGTPTNDTALFPQDSLSEDFGNSLDTLTNDRPTSFNLAPRTDTAAALPPGGRLVPFDFDPATLGMGSLSREAYKLVLKVTDEEGERTVFERYMAAGEAAHETVTVYGDGLLQTYVNDNLFQAWKPY